MANLVSRINDEYAEAGSEASLAVLTSDAEAKHIWDKIDIKINWALMWNLPRKASEEYISQIGLEYRVAGELGIGGEKAKEILWRLAGGQSKGSELHIRSRT